MATNYSSLLELISGRPQTIDFSNINNILTLGGGGLQLNGSTSGNFSFTASPTTTSYAVVWPAAQGGANTFLRNDGSGILTWASAGTGSVTSVAFSDASTTPIYSISGSPVTTSGTLTQTLSTQSANLVFAGPSSGSAAQPTFRAIVAADLPGGGAYANDTLSNLSSPTAVNRDLSPGTNTTFNLGSSSFVWNNLYLTTNIIDSFGTNAIAVGTRKLYDLAGLLSVDFSSNRALVDASAATQLSWSASGVKFNQLTASTVPYLNSSKVLVSSAVTPTELGYVSGVTSSIQTQLSGKLDLSGGTMSGVLNMGSNQISNLAAGSSSSDAVNYGQVILVAGTNAFTSNQSMGGNKLTNLANGTAGTDAVNFSQLSAISSGLVWLAAINDPDLIDDSLSTPPGSPVYSITYIIAASGTGAWAGLDGHAVWWDGVNWIDISTGNTANSGFGTAVQVGDRFGVCIANGSALTPAGGLTGKKFNIAQVTGNTPGSFTYTFTAPVAGYAVSVTDPGSQHFGSSFTYSSASSTWVDFAGPSKAVAGNALSYSGNTLNVLYDTSSVSLNGSNQLEIAVGGVTPVKLGTITDNVTLDQSGSGSTLEIKSGGVGTTQLASASVTIAKLGTITDGVTLDQSGAGSSLEIKDGGVSATKLGSVTDGVTLDQSGAGSTIEIKAAGVSATQLATGAFDQATILGGAGTAAHVAYSPSVSTVALYGGAATLSANTTYAMRYGIPANSETVGRLYVADWTATSFDMFWVVGLYKSATTTATGVSITVISQGPYTIGSSDTTFGSSDQGKPAWLGAAGAVGPDSSFSPASGNANEKIGIVTGVSTIWVSPQMMGVS